MRGATACSRRTSRRERRNKMDINAISFPPWLQTLGLVVLAVFVLYKMWKSQSSEIDAGTISSLNRQIAAFKDEVTLYKNQMHELTLLVGEQSGIIKVQKETIDKYELILQNRNPELTEILKEISEFMKNLKSEMNVQTALLQKGEERAGKVASAMVK